MSGNPTNENTIEAQEHKIRCSDERVENGKTKRGTAMSQNHQSRTGSTIKQNEVPR